MKASPPPDPQSPIEGLRAWLARLDRSLGIRTYILGAISLLALAAGVVAVVLVLQLKQDSASKDDVDALSTQLSTVSDQAAQAAEDKAKALDDRISALETKVDRLSGDQSKVQQQLDKLKQEVSSNVTAGGRKGGGDNSTRLKGVFPNTGKGSAIPGTSGSGSGGGTGSEGGGGEGSGGGTAPGG